MMRSQQLAQRAVMQAKLARSWEREVRLVEHHASEPLTYAKEAGEALVSPESDAQSFGAAYLREKYSRERTQPEALAGPAFPAPARSPDPGDPSAVAHPPTRTEPGPTPAALYRGDDSLALALTQQPAQGRRTARHPLAPRSDPRLGLSRWPPPSRPVSTRSLFSLREQLHSRESARDGYRVIASGFSFSFSPPAAVFTRCSPQVARLCRQLARRRRRGRQLQLPGAGAQHGCALAK